MSSNANFATTPRYAVATVSTANTNWDGTGTIVTAFTAGDNGSRVDQIGWSCEGTSSAGLLNMFVREDSEDDWTFIFGITISAATASTTAPPHAGGVTNLNWVLSGGAQIGFSTTVSQTINIHITLAGDF